MAIPRCPGQDIRFWKPKDIFEVQCPYCGEKIEFWKDDPSRYCSSCSERVSNPRIDLSCAKWCEYAKECLGTLPDELVAAAPVVERLTALLTKRLTGQPTRMKCARKVCALAETLMIAGGGKPYIIKSAALLAGVLIMENGELLDAPSQENVLLGDFHSWKTILEQSGVESSVADEICAIIDAIVSGKSQESPEFAVVWDAVQLERLSLIHNSYKTSIAPVSITNAMRTQSGRKMAKKYNGGRDT